MLDKLPQNSSVLHLGAPFAAVLLDVVGSLGAQHFKRSYMRVPCLTGGCLGMDMAELTSENLKLNASF